MPPTVWTSCMIHNGLILSDLLLSTYSHLFTIAPYRTPVSRVRSLRARQLACRYACPHLRRPGQREFPCKRNKGNMLQAALALRVQSLSKEWEGSATGNISCDLLDFAGCELFWIWLLCYAWTTQLSSSWPVCTKLGRTMEICASSESEKVPPMSERHVNAK